jgi:hypothetical protein
VLAYANAGLGNTLKCKYSRKVIIFIASCKSLQHNNGHIKKEITVEVIIHEYKKDITCTLYINQYRILNSAGNGCKIQIVTTYSASLRIR